MNTQPSAEIELEKDSLYTSDAAPQEGFIRAAKVVSVIEVEHQWGLGKTGNPVRIVKTYYALDGELLASTEIRLKVEPDEIKKK